MRWLMIVIGILLIFFVGTLPTQAQSRLAECDACGYCYGREAPISWNACAQCLYPQYGVDKKSTPTQLRTLRVDPKFNRAPVPAQGKYYTQLGCLDVGLSSFSNPLAAGGVLNFILTRFLFPIAGVLAFLALVYGAFLLITAQDNFEQIGRGKAWIYGAIIGIIFTLSSIFIVQIIGADILKIPGFSQGPKIQFAMYGTSATVNGKVIYPNLRISFDGSEVGLISQIQGSPKSIDTATIHILKQIDFSKTDNLSKLQFELANDACWKKVLSGSVCCNPQKRDPTNVAYDIRCSDEFNHLYNGDVNIYISSITIDDKQCIRARYGSDIINLQTNRIDMFYGTRSLVCEELK